MKRTALVLACASALACSRSESTSQAHANSSKPSSPGEAKRTPKEPERQVFSLVDNRLLAHVQRGGGAVLVGGSAGLAKYLHFGRPRLGWQLGQTLDGKRVGLAERNTTLDVPLTEEQAGSATAIRIRLHSTRARRMTALLGSKPAGTVELAPTGWQTLEIPLPSGLARAGENTLQIVFSDGPPVAIEWIQIGGTPISEAPQIYDASRRALVLPQGGGVAYYVQIPKEGRLVGAVLGDRCEVSVRVKPHGRPALEGTLRGSDGEVDLSSLAGSIARLDLIALTSKTCDEALLVEGALVVPGAQTAVARPKRPKNAILWIMDSLRADRVKPFFPAARPDVPHFEKLASLGTIFRNAYVQGNESRASHASIWSSLYVSNHRMIPGGEKVLLAKWPTMGELMKEAGLFTSGVSANGYITKRWGFGDGWDAYRNHIHDGGGVRGEDVLKYALQSIEKRTKEPFFLYLGTIDTHVSWRAKQPWMAKYDPGPYSGRYVTEASGKDVEKMATGKLPVSDRDKTRIIAIYDSNVSYQDDLLGKLFDSLGAWTIRDDTMVVITADHGDEQWEDGRVGHGGSLRESLVHVPLAIVYPPLFPPGIVEEGVDTIDIVPTLLDALGQKAPDSVQGESLIPLAQGVGRGYPRPSIASQYEDAYAMRLAGWKVRVAGSNVPRLYHVEKDPYEKADRAAERPIERRFLTDVFSTFLVFQKQWKKSRWGVASNASPQFAADLGE